MKTIAIFSGYYFPHLGGVERYTYNLAKELHCMGYNIIIITSQYDIEQKNIEKTELAKIYRIPTYKVLVSRYPINKINKKYSKKRTKKVIKLLKKYKIPSITKNKNKYGNIPFLTAFLFTNLFLSNNTLVLYHTFRLFYY